MHEREIKRKNEHSAEQSIWFVIKQLRNTASWLCHCCHLSIPFILLLLFLCLSRQRCLLSMEMIFISAFDFVAFYTLYRVWCMDTILTHPLLFTLNNASPLTKQNSKRTITPDRKSHVLNNSSKTLWNGK